MKILYKNEITEVEENTNLKCFLEKQSINGYLNIVIHNGHSIVLHEWEKVILKENDNVELIKFIVGG